MTSLETTESTMRQVTDGLRFPEGPVAMSDGSVLVVEIQGGDVTRVRPDGVREVVAECGGGPNGAAFGPDGALYVCNDGGLTFTDNDGITTPGALTDDNPGGTIQRVDVATGDVTTVLDHGENDLLGCLNDIVFDASGWCWFVDTTKGLLHRADPIGGEVRTACDDLQFPNGFGLSPDGTRAYASETYSGKIWAWNVLDGDLVDRSLIHDTGGVHGWDGLAIDGAGNVCVANLSQSGITVLTAEGDFRVRFETPLYDQFVTNICFGGDDGRTAWISSSGRGLLYEMRWPWPGLALHFSQ